MEELHELVPLLVEVGPTLGNFVVLLIAIWILRGKTLSQYAVALRQSNAELMNVQERLATLALEFAKQTQEHAEEISSLQRNYENKIASLQAEIRRLEAQIVELKQQNEELRKEVVKWKGQLKS